VGCGIKTPHTQTTKEPNLLTAKHNIARSLVIALLLMTAMFFSTTTSAMAKPSHAKPIDYKGYVMAVKYPSIGQCNRYEKDHKGAARYYLWCARFQYVQAKHVAAHTKGWYYVWNPKWAVAIIRVESSGIPGNSNGLCWGLFQVATVHVSKDPYRLFNAVFNIRESAYLFSNQAKGPWWSDRHKVLIYAFASRAPKKAAHKASLKVVPST